ncbi:MAG: SulP family inorganic anion transporter, partial [Verrucomicrobia bacterium]|nr:SulP family inorganic anion transporter [Verrucomicrobiota bacterium]
LSGVTVGLIALPLALALGVASIPPGVATPLPAPAIGIFTAIIGGFLVSLLGGSRVQVAGPTAAFVTVVLFVLQKHGFDGLILSTLMAGVILILMGLTGMGTLVKFIPYPVTSGFTTGIAIALVVSQAPAFLGVQTASPPPGEFLKKIPWLFTHLPDASLPTVLIGIVSTVFIIVWPKFRARLHAERIPGAIIAMAVSAVVVAWLGWEQAHG